MTYNKEISDLYLEFVSSLPSQAYFQSDKMCVGLNVVISVLYAFEFLLSVILIYWESKGLCRAHFNSLVMHKDHLHSFKTHM